MKGGARAQARPKHTRSGPGVRWTQRKSKKNLRTYLGFLEALCDRQRSRDAACRERRLQGPGPLLM